MSSLNISTATRHAAVTPSDTLPNGFSALFIGGAGTIKITDTGDVAVTYTVPAGTLLPIQTKLVWATGTTATLIVGLSGG